jgi:hypothetical protein
MKSCFLIFVILILSLYFIFFSKVLIDTFNQWQDKIDAYIYINLEDREDRKKTVLEELEKMGIPKNKIRKVSGVRIPKNGHKGCTQSHILALTMAKMNKWKRVAIFEDDMKLNVEPSEFTRILNKSLELDDDKWDVLILGGANQEKGDKIDEDMFYLKHSTTTTGYIVKQEYYDYLLDLFNDANNKMVPVKWGGGNDWEPNAPDQRWNELIKVNKFIGFEPNLIVQGGSPSSINGEQTY